MSDLVQRLRKRAVDFRSDRLREIVLEAADRIEDLDAGYRRLEREVSRLEAELEHKTAVLRTAVENANSRLATINSQSKRMGALTGLVVDWITARRAAIAAPLNNPGAWSRLADAEQALSATAAPHREAAE